MALIGYPLASDLLATQGFGQGRRRARRGRLINVPDNPALRGLPLARDRPVGQGGRIDDSPSTRRIPYDLLHRLRRERRLADDEQRHDVRRRSSRPTASARSATSRWRRPIRTSSTSAPARPTTASRARTATASGRARTRWRPNAADVKFENIGLRDTQAIARMIVHPKDPNTCGSPRRAISTGRTPSAACS